MAFNLDLEGNMCINRLKITSRQSKPEGPLDNFSREQPASPSRVTTALYIHITVSTIQSQEGSIQ